MKPILLYFKKLHVFAGARLYVNMLLGLLISFFDSLGILLILPMLSLIGFADSTVTQLPIISDLLKPLVSLPASLSLPLVLGLYVTILTLTGLLQRNQSVVSVGIHQGFIRFLRLDTYRTLIESDWSFFLKKRSSDFQHILTSELARVSQGTQLFLSLVQALIFTVIQIALAFLLSPILTVMVLVSGLLLAAFARRFVGRAKQLGNRTSELSQNYFLGINEHFHGMKEMKSNRMEQSHLNWFQELCVRMEQNMVQFTRLQATTQVYYRLASAALIAVFVYVSLQVFHVQTGQMLLIVLILGRLWPRFSSIQSNVEQIYSSIPAFNSVMKLKAECEAARELNLQSQALQNIEPLPLEEALECRNVYFRYNRNEGTCALRNINLRIPSGSLTAIVGKSGAGKSTLIDMLMGMIQPERGEVVVDGKQLTPERLTAFRASVSYVSQDPFLFHATIRENMLLVKPEATETEIWDALRFSASDEFVQQLPQGLDTVLGDRGIRLSGGERQRIVLARAILRQPSILILDEATSALDLENEAKIRTAIDQLKGKMTIIVIAHRLSTIRNADQVLVMEQGELIQQGGYQQLSSDSKGRFSKLLHMQADQTLQP
ncbi:ABC transporter ATP-binding protein [Paenibacillus sp. GCM10012307]|uniref:ABC transporter ATP-binding protein n=1 Tax=Paenibacillus roseus TaxID=2798579 RepID=A0A934IVU9_9BACL|nr:ABC transporter ATP-binding protein [Paenibacillus roseus]MBJ6360242.1 ABC transporter ATP-binding protein [Paenibacillus roseus]